MSELHVVFQVADADYMVAARHVLHLESFDGATRVPGSPDFVSGIVQSRGRLVPVLDLRKRFALPAVELSLDTRIIIVQVAQRVVGLLVDRAREVVRVAQDELRDPPELISRRARFVRCVAEIGASKRMVLLIDLAKVIEDIADEERDADKQ